MSDYSLRVKLKDFEFEAHATNPDEVRSMIDDCTKKYLSSYTEWNKTKLKA